MGINLFQYKLPTMIDRPILQKQSNLFPGQTLGAKMITGIIRKRSLVVRLSVIKHQWFGDGGLHLIKALKCSAVLFCCWESL